MSKRNIKFDRAKNQAKLDIESRLASGQSKEQTMEIVEYVCSHPNKMDVLMSCFFSDKTRLCQRAAWPISYVGRRRPDLVYPYLRKIIELLDHPLHDAIVRNTLRVMEEMELPEEYHGEMYDRCYRYIDDVKAPAAFRAFAMTVAFRIVNHYPELANEFKVLIETHFEHGKASFKSRGGKILKALNKLSSKS